MTTPERHEKVYELFVNARKLDDATLAAYLAKACADDVSLREEVEVLLAQDSEMTSFLEQPPAQTPLGSAGSDTVSSAGKPPAAESRASDALAGIIIEGYEILRELHRGGQGVVFQAVQKSTKRKVAIKVLREGPYASKSAKKRFEREIELVAQLKHPNIIAIFDSGTTAGGWQYCTMDYVRGTQLNHHIRENKLTLEETLNVFKQVCDAVQYAHHKGVIHRDLKPSNILVDSEGNAKVLDFGLAKQMIGPVQTVVSMTQEVIGTLPYMSPEQAKGNPDHIDTRTDIYALGVILYEILTGHYPYPVVGQMADVLKHIVETPPTPPSSQWTPESGVTKRSSKHLRPGKCPIDDELQTVILKTLSKERERRYQSAGALAEDISHYLAEEPVEAKRDSNWYVFKKTLKRYRVPVTVTGLMILVTMASAITLFTLYRQKSALLREVDHQRQVAELERDRALAAERKAEQRRGAAVSAVTRLRRTAELLDVIGELTRFARAKMEDEVGLDVANRTVLGERLLAIVHLMDGLEDHGARPEHLVAFREWIAVILMRILELPCSAEELLVGAVGLRQQLHGLGSSELLNSQRLLCEAMAANGKIEDALVLARQILEEARGLPEEAHLDLIDTLLLLVRLYIQKREPYDAVSSLSEIIEVERSTFGSLQPQTVVLAKDLVRIFREYGDESYAHEVLSELSNFDQD